MFNKKTIISYELCLDNSDWETIDRALPELAKRRIAFGHSLAWEFLYDPFEDNILLFLENLGISFAKKIRTYKKDDFFRLENVIGFKNAIYKIDNKVEDYISSNNIKLKASDFRNKEDFKYWVDRFNSNELAEVLWKVISNNQDNLFADKIISELGEYLQ